MALIAVVALGLMGFAMGYAKAGRTSSTIHAQGASMPGIAAARVSLVTAGDGEMTLTSVESPAPAKPLSRPVAVMTRTAVETKPAAQPLDATPAPEAEPASAQETSSISKPV
ncbi:MAG: hypothetical protein JWM33_3599 [Caulobacteraceae bacterium]|nr:hypothetical protein [Caulobacteraceae bacterium]